MALYRWKSEYLKGVGRGHIIVSAQSVEEAREIAWRGFRSHFYTKYCWMYDSIQDAVRDDRSDLDRCLQQFEDDLAPEPEILPDYILIPGSE